MQLSDPTLQQTTVSTKEHNFNKVEHVFYDSQNTALFEISIL